MALVCGIKHHFLQSSGCLNTLYRRLMLPVHRSFPRVPYFSLIHKIGFKGRARSVQATLVLKKKRVMWETSPLGWGFKSHSRALLKKIF